MNHNLYFTNAMIYMEHEILHNASLLVEQGKIMGIYPEGLAPKNLEAIEIIDVQGNRLVPGFIDVHVHGGGGFDAMNAGSNPEVIHGLSRFVASKGTTSYLPTTLTDEEENLVKVLASIKQAMKENAEGAEVLGVHLEGPFVNPARCGAQNPADMRVATLDEIKNLITASGNTLKLITLAPELEGMMDIIASLVEQGVTVSIGHSDAGYDVMKEAVQQGATHITHLFNGMSPLHHREPGVAGSALMLDELAVEMICDGLHIREELVKYVFRIKPNDKIVLITDGVGATGCPDGEYMLGKLPIILQGNKVCLKHGGSLAGSCLTMDQAMRNAVQFTGRPLEEVLAALTLNPARQIHVDDRKGSIAEGKDADVVILSDNLEILATFVKGMKVYQAQ